MKLLFLLLFCLIAFTCALNIPDIAIIPNGVYHVFEEARDKNAKFSTIQKAIDQALCDGFTPESGMIAKIIIHQSKTPYTGDNPENEINVPSSVRLHGDYGGSLVNGPQIKATLVMTNEGSAPFDSLDDLKDLPWTTSGLNFIQPSEDKQSIVYTQDLDSFSYVPAFTDCYFSSPFTNSNVSLVEISNFPLLLMDRVWAFSASPAPFIKANDAGSVEILNSVLICYKLALCVGVGEKIPGTALFLRNVDVAVEPGFLGNLNTDIVVFEVLSNGWERMFMYHNDIKTFGNDGLAGDVVIFRASPSVNDSLIDFSENLYGMYPGTSGTFLLYDAPNATIYTGTNTVRVGTISATNAILVSNTLV